jgi:hypothetical protein
MSLVLFCSLCDGRENKREPDIIVKYFYQKWK